jgi:4-amino-4-deoxy-L-arabinose transferase-like glycosyltransferase
VSTQNTLRRTISPRWLLLVGALLLLFRLDYATFWNPDEGRYAAASLEMAQPFDGSASDWVVPRLNTIPRLNKPPLVYWLAGSSFKVFGPGEWSGRLPSALFAVGVMLLLYALGRKFWSERAGLFGAMVWATSVFPVAMGRTLNTDMLLCGSMALALFGIWNALEGDEKHKWRSCLIAGVGMGLALLAKGPVGVAIPLFIAFVYLCVARRWKQVPWLGVAAALILALAIAGPWYAAANAREPEFLKQFLGDENLKRFSGGEQYHDPTTPLFYLPVLFVGLLPWTAFLIPAVAAWWSREMDEARRLRLFLWLWAAIIFAGFSVSSTKLVSYVLPAFPALALLVGEGVSRVLDKANAARKADYAALALTCALNVILGIGALIALRRVHAVSQSEGAFYGALIAVVLLVGTVFLALSWRRADTWRVGLVQTGTAVLLAAAVLQLASAVNKYEDSSSLTKLLASHLRPGDIVMQSAFQPTQIFYAARPISQAYFVNSSGLDEDALRASPHFLQLVPPEIERSPNLELRKPYQQKRDQIIREHLKSARRVFVLVRIKDYLTDEPFPGAHLWGRNNDYFLLSNQPKPAEFEATYFVPGKKRR